MCYFKDDTNGISNRGNNGNDDYDNAWLQGNHAARNVKVNPPFDPFGGFTNVPDLYPHQLVSLTR